MYKIPLLEKTMNNYQLLMTGCFFKINNIEIEPYVYKRLTTMDIFALKKEELIAYFDRYHGGDKCWQRVRSNIVKDSLTQVFELRKQ